MAGRSSPRALCIGRALCHAWCRAGKGGSDRKNVVRAYTLSRRKETSPPARRRSFRTSPMRGAGGLYDSEADLGVWGMATASTAQRSAKSIKKMACLYSSYNRRAWNLDSENETYGAGRNCIYRSLSMSKHCTGLYDVQYFTIATQVLTPSSFFLFFFFNLFSYGSSASSTALQASSETPPRSAFMYTACTSG